MNTDSLPAIVQYYNEFKTAIFTTSLTLGTFLFTMKSFIIQTMKKEVYDNEMYQRGVLARIKEGKTEETIYGPLKRLKRLMFWTIISAIGNALLQIVLGYFKNIYCVIIGLTTTGISWIMVVICLVHVSMNLTDMLGFNESKAKE